MRPGNNLERREGGISQRFVAAMALGSELMREIGRLKSRGTVPFKADIKPIQGMIREMKRLLA